MKKQLLVLAAGLALASCANKPADRQADWDRACTYATGVLSAAEPFIPTVKGLLLARFGEDATLAFDAATTVIKSACSAPLDVSSTPEIVQRVYDAGGEIVALVVRASQQ